MINQVFSETPSIETPQGRQQPGSAACATTKFITSLRVTSSKLESGFSNDFINDRKSLLYAEIVFALNPRSTNWLSANCDNKRASESTSVGSHSLVSFRVVGDAVADLALAYDLTMGEGYT